MLSFSLSAVAVPYNAYNSTKALLRLHLAQFFSTTDNAYLFLVHFSSPSPSHSSFSTRFGSSVRQSSVESSTSML